LRAWVVAKGKAPHPWGSFEEWSQLIDGAVVYAGHPSTVYARRDYRDRSDDGRDTLRALFQLLRDKYPAGVTTAKLVSDYPCQPQLGDVEAKAHGRAVLEAIKPRYTAATLGYALRALKGRRVDGLYMESELDRTNVKRWKVVCAETSPASPAAPKSAGDAGDAGDAPLAPGKNAAPTDAGEARNLSKTQERPTSAAEVPVVKPVAPSPDAAPKPPKGAGDGGPPSSLSPLDAMFWRAHEVTNAK
jgi:hypothetical protein